MLFWSRNKAIFIHSSFFIIFLADGWPASSRKDLSSSSSLSRLNFFCRFYAFLLKSWMFLHILEYLEYFEIFWNIMEYFGIFLNVLEYFWIFWNIPEYFGMFLNILEYSWIFWNHPEYFGVFLKILEYSCTFWNIPEYFGIFLNTLEYSGIIYPAARTEMFFSLV